MITQGETQPLHQVVKLPQSTNLLSSILACLGLQIQHPHSWRANTTHYSTRPGLPWYAHKIVTLLAHSGQSSDCLTRLSVGYHALGMTFTDQSLALYLDNASNPLANYPTPCLSIALQFGSMTVPSSPPSSNTPKCVFYFGSSRCRHEHLMLLPAHTP
eukprot:Gb_01286 [translate_table: standard]